jgi:hypothetical protein
LVIDFRKTIALKPASQGLDDLYFLQEFNDMEGGPSIRLGGLRDRKHDKLRDRLIPKY